MHSTVVDKIPPPFLFGHPAANPIWSLRYSADVWVVVRLQRVNCLIGCSCEGVKAC